MAQSPKCFSGFQTQSYLWLFSCSIHFNMVRRSVFFLVFTEFWVFKENNFASYYIPRLCNKIPLEEGWKGLSNALLPSGLLEGMKVSRQDERNNPGRKPGRKGGGGKLKPVSRGWWMEECDIQEGKKGKPPCESLCPSLKAHFKAVFSKVPSLLPHPLWNRRMFSLCLPYSPHQSLLLCLGLRMVS